MISKVYGPVSGDLYPVYNKIDYTFNSDNKNEVGFEYVIELFETGTTDKIYEYRIPPRSSDGMCQVGVNKILSNLVSYDIIQEPDDYVSYTWNANFLSSNGTNALLSYYSGTSSYPSGYQAGDIVTLTTSTIYGDERDSLNGTYSVLSIGTFISPNDSIVINLPYTGIIKATSTITQLIKEDVGLAVNSGYGYDIQVGESYFGVDWNASSYDIYNGYMSLTGTASHNNIFKLGDMVLLTTPTYGDDRDLFNNYFRVRNILSDYTIVIDLETIGMTGSIDTNVSLSTVRSVIRNLWNDTGVYVCNGILDHRRYLDYTQDIYKPNTTNVDGEFLLDSPRTDLYLKAVKYNRKNILVSDDSYAYLNFFHKSGGDDVYYARFRKYIGESSIGSFITDPFTRDGVIRQLKAGPGNLPKLTKEGFYPWEYQLDQVTTYDVVLLNAAKGEISEKIVFTFDKRCVINDIEMLFMDRLGSIVPVLFQLRSKKKLDVKRETYNRRSTGLGNSYDSTIPLENIYRVDINETYTITTNWMERPTALYYEQLFSSPFKQIKIDGVYYSCIVTNTSTPIFNPDNKRLIQYTLDVELSIKSKTNI